MNTYITIQGDTIFTITTKIYGDMSKFLFILQLNKSLNLYSIIAPGTAIIYNPNIITNQNQ